MKYSEDLEIYKTKTGTYRIGTATYHLKICPVCNEKCLCTENRKFCSKICAKSREYHPNTGKHHSEETKRKISNSLTGQKLSEETKRKIGESQKEEKHPNWKGGVKKLNIPLFDTYAPQIEKYEEVKKSPEGYLEIKCTYCNKWYIPKTKSIQDRIYSINNKDRGENRLYCSKECKQNCPIYNQKKYEKGYKPATSREVQPELRKLVFKRDNWTCIKCKATKNLHCHHIEGLNQNPIESADIDMCITVCKPCHKDIHKQKDCRYNDLKCKKYLDEDIVCSHR